MTLVDWQTVHKIQSSQQNMYFNIYSVLQ